MNASQESTLAERLAHLEQRVALLESLTLPESADGPPAPTAIAPTTPAAEPILAASAEEVSRAARCTDWQRRR